MGEVNFYYLRDENGKSYGCVAFCENEDGTVNRGISICSKEDAFKKVAARGIALKRMNDAIKRKESFDHFGYYYGDKQSCPDCFEAGKDIFQYKSAYAVKSTAKEHRILYKPENN
jgi:hypothetical protein